MPTGTDASSASAGITRRACLRAVTALLAAPAAVQGREAARVVAMAAAWDDAEGRHHVGVVELTAPGGANATAPAPLRIRHALQVPTRAHAVLPCPDGTLVAVARRPGAWMLRWRPGSPAPMARWLWSEADRSFNGHVQLDGPHALVCTETDAADGAGLLVRRDALTLAVLQEWPTGGIDPHAVLALPGGGWLVANGGVPTRPESGRVKGDRSTMDSSLVRLDAQGAQQGAWRLADKRLSLRHLARHGDGLVGVALQAEHDDADDRRNAPIIALWDGQHLRLGERTALQGYAGDIVTWPSGFMLSATRAGCVARFDLQGQLVAQHPLAQACAMASANTLGWLAGGTPAYAMVRGDTNVIAASTSGVRLDNHWAQFGS